MSALIVIGINHETAAVDTREKVAFAPEQMPQALRNLCNTTSLAEVVILSTCNRTEIIAMGAVHAEQEILQWLTSYHELTADALSSCYYCYQGEVALHHIMKVASGLDSLVLGEPQILGQMKSAFAVAEQEGVATDTLAQMMRHTFAYAKKVRTQTAIGQNPVSVAFAAVHLAQRIFSDIADTKALLIGAGQTIDLVAKHLTEKGIGKIIVANRTMERAEYLAQQYKAEAILLSDIPNKLVDVDMVISSTASQLPILGKGTVERVTKKRKHKPMFMLDIAVPRDIEPEVADLSDVYLYTVDDLKDIVDENKKARLDEAKKADDILQEGVLNFRKSQRVNALVPWLKTYRSHAESVRDQEIQKAMKALESGASPQKVLEQVAYSVTNKLIHTPSANLKKMGEQGNFDQAYEFINMLGIEPFDEELDE